MSEDWDNSVTTGAMVDRVEELKILGRDPKRYTIGIILNLFKLFVKHLIYTNLKIQCAQILSYVLRKDKILCSTVEQVSCQSAAKKTFVNFFYFRVDKLFLLYRI